MTEDVSTDMPSGPRGVAKKSDVMEMIVRRWLGTWIDLIVIGAGVFVIDVPLIAVVGAKVNPGLVGLMLILWVVLYFVVGEGLWGRTVGKLVTGLVVVDETGTPPGMIKALIRTLLRLVEVNPLLLGGLPAAGFVAWGGPFRQRLGDLAASTYVVSARRLREAKAVAV